jgi:hypothetical protein
MQHAHDGTDLRVKPALQRQQGTGLGDSIEMYKPTASFLDVRLLVQDFINHLSYFF